MFIMTGLVLAVVFTFAQQFPMAERAGMTGTRYTHDFQCMDSYVFSQLLPEYDNGAFCDQGYTFSKVAESYSAMASFSAMRFWGYRDIKATEDFLIEFYDGVPGEAGTNVVHSFNVTLVPVATPYYQFDSPTLPIYEFNVDFGMNISLLEGWVSISRLTLPYVDRFAWLGYYVANGSLSYNQTNHEWVSNSVEVFFCLGKAFFIPLSGWALFLGLGLILVFTVFRYRRLS
jgi:hypothetical protein